MTLNLTSDVAAALASLAASRGLSIEDYLRQIVEQELETAPSDVAPEGEGSGMILENGLFIYGAGTALPSAVVDDAVRRLRDERAKHILGDWA